MRPGDTWAIGVFDIFRFLTCVQLSCARSEWGQFARHLCRYAAGAMHYMVVNHGCIPFVMSQNRSCHCVSSLDEFLA